MRNGAEITLALPTYMLLRAPSLAEKANRHQTKIGLKIREVLQWTIFIFSRRHLPFQRQN